MVQVTFGGPALEGFTADMPAASVRLLLPSVGSTELVMPAWNGNEFLLPDGRRPVIRTFTPRRADPGSGELDLDIVVHGGGAASQWAAAATPGDRAAVSGPGRGYVVAGDASDFVLAGDETAIPAMSQLLEVIPPTVPVRVLVEIGAPEGRLDVFAHPRATVEWHEQPLGSTPGEPMVDAVRSAEVGPDTKVWAAGEAAAIQAIRQHLFQQRGLPRSQASIRGYWKHGRAADETSADADEP